MLTVPCSISKSQSSTTKKVCRYCIYFPLSNDHLLTVLMQLKNVDTSFLYERAFNTYSLLNNIYLGKTKYLNAISIADINFPETCPSSEELTCVAHNTF